MYKSVSAMSRNAFRHCNMRMSVLSKDSCNTFLLDKQPRIDSISSPRVIPPVNEDNIWKLWFTAHFYPENTNLTKSSHVYHATSVDGLSSWEIHPNSPVVQPSNVEGNWWWHDSHSVNVGDVILPGSGRAQNKFLTSDSVYMMYTYGGTNEASIVDGVSVRGRKLEIGLAVSQDSLFWSKIEGYSAYCSILQIGEEGDFDRSFVASPSLVETDRGYFMYYHTFDNSIKKYVVGLSEARDGILDWKKLGSVFQGSGQEFDAGGVKRRHVNRLTDGTFRMWYEGVSSQGQHSIGLASSRDGIQWTSATDKPVFRHNDDSSAWDAGGVGSPHVIWIPETQRWRMYYVGFSDSAAVEGDGIGVAESVDETGNNFRRL